MEVAFTNYYVVTCLIVVKEPVHSSLGIANFRKGLHHNHAGPGFAHVLLMRFLFVTVSFYMDFSANDIHVSIADNKTTPD